MKKLSEEEKKWLKKIAQKSDLLKNPNPTAGEKVREREIGGSKGAGGNYKIETSRSNARRSER